MYSLLFELGRSRRAPLRVSAVAIGAAALIASYGAPAAAQVCVQSPSFVPGLSGPPIWAGAAGTVRIDLNDPRWGNAPLTPFPQDPNGSQAGYRIIKNGQELSVSIHVITDPALNASDSVFFGFTEGGTVAHLARINLPASGVEPITPTIFHAWDRSAALWTDAGAVQPAWLRDPRAWRRAAAPPVNPGDPGWEAVKAGVEWAINFKVDLPAGALTTDFRVFVAAHVTTSGSAIEYHLPDYPPDTALVPGTIAPEASETTAWQAVTALGTACPAGISINSSNIGTTNTPSNKINTDVDFANVFYADPSGIPAPEDGRVLARFRMAHWGSTIADPQAPWTDLATVPSVSGASHLHTFTCTPPAGGTCPTLGPGEDTHQCVMVELRPAGGALGAGLVFNRSIAYRNMDFENLSTLSREARITIKGLQAATGKAQDRDVYLYVKESNLPPHGNEQIFLPNDRMSLARRFAEAPPPRSPRPKEGKPNEPEAPVKGAVPAARAPVAAKPPSAAAPGKPVAPSGPTASAPSAQVPPKPEERIRVSGPISPFGAASPHEALVSVFPTYEVHVYYDTGNVVKIDGREQRVLRPMVPFGYYLSHDGPLYGFATKFEALNGVALEELAPNFYRVKIPNEGAIKVRTTITAEEKPRGRGTETPQCPACPPRGRCHCDVPGAPVASGGWLVAAGALGLVAAGRRSRRRRNRASS